MTLSFATMIPDVPPPSVAPGDVPIRHFDGGALGSPLRLQVHDGTRDAADTAWAAVRDEFAAVDTALSRHRQDSELTAINRLAGSGRKLAVGERLYMAIAATDRARRLTDGRFDARVLEDLERLGDHGAPLDAVERRADAMMLQRDPVARTVALDRPHDLGGIGKGLGLRWAAALAAAILGPRVGFLLEAGGDVIVRGRPIDQPTWSIGIEDPSHDGSPVAVVDVVSGAICTSSIARRSWRTADGRVAHHLIDPGTGEPGGAGLRAVTVAGADPAWAEAWSKALFLEGRGGIAGLARADGLAAWWIDTDDELGMTPAARIRTLWTRDPDGTG
ncbi:MAG: FAD:protein FMN transferase [Candidatus Limnocylindrales bacterium]